MVSPAGPIVNLLVVDAHPIYRRGVVASLRDLPEVAVITDVAGVVEAREHAALAQADVIIIDHDATGAHELMRELSAIGRARAIVCSSRCAEHDVLAAIGAGAVGVLSKQTLTPEALVGAVRAAAGGAGVLAPVLLGQLLAGARANGTRTNGTGTQRSRATQALTARERRVLSLIADGQATREVARELSYSERTVKNVLHDAVTKLHARSRSQAVARAVRSGLI
jgi:DNA-binding NarL/FixJ family response regulator